MFINLKDGKLTLYDLVLDEKINAVLEKISYDGPLKIGSIKTTGWISEGRRNNNTIIRFVHGEKTGVTYSYNDFYSEDKEEYKVSYYEYTLPQIYLVIEELLKDNYTALRNLSKYQTGKTNDIKEAEIFDKYRAEIDEYICLEKIIELENNGALGLISLLKQNSKGKLKTNLDNLNNYLYVHSLKLDGIKIKEKIK